MMKQVLQDLKNGTTEVVNVPCPVARQNQLLVRSTRTLLSAGTERALVDFGRAGWVAKARQQPDKVRMVLDKIKADGLLLTVDALRSKLEQPVPMGYCNVGVVTAVGEGISTIAVGDRVASNGHHAEVIAVSRNLCARVPDHVSDDEAAFTALGAIALQGIRLAAPTLGECFVVIGLGLVGLLAVQLLRANGCRVLGIDPDPARCSLAQRFGARTVGLGAGENPLAIAETFSGGRGVDGVLITAATRSNEPMTHAARMCRKRGRIVLVGVVGLDLDRADFYQKEISFQVSCSYGPGRYDPEYEEQGNDYPLGFVRWTEQRNLEAVLEMMCSGTLDVKPLISHRFPIESAAAAYELLVKGGESPLGILLDYPADEGRDRDPRTVALTSDATRAGTGKAPNVAFIGAGNYAGRVLIPAFVATGARMRAIASTKGVTAAHFGRKFGFGRATSDSEALVAAEDIDIVVIATRHDSHARFVVQALQAGKHVFVEKPLAIEASEIKAVERAHAAAGSAGRRPHVMVGFNRRFAPHVVRMKGLLANVREPKSIVVTVNAGAIPASHWIRDRRTGGGRIIGECCHFVDLARFLIGCPIADSRVQALRGAAGAACDDNATITLSFEDGSSAAIHYLANGHAAFSKERIELFCAGRILQLDNFRRLRGYGWPGFSSMNLWRQDKGQTACARAFVEAVRDGGRSPIAFDELIEVSRIVVALGEAAQG
jgi:predicted dehydrogenase/threonine dehydrogenase-like Zn-dependent dehydrogenase